MISPVTVVSVPALESRTWTSAPASEKMPAMAEPMLPLPKTVTVEAVVVMMVSVLSGVFRPR